MLQHTVPNHKISVLNHFAWHCTFVIFHDTTPIKHYIQSYKLSLTVLIDLFPGSTFHELDCQVCPGCWCSTGPPGTWWGPHWSRVPPPTSVPRSWRPSQSQPGDSSVGATLYSASHRFQPISKPPWLAANLPCWYLACPQIGCPNHVARCSQRKCCFSQR